MSKAADMIFEAQLDVHLVCDLLRVLYNAVPDDTPGGLPVHGTLKHILKLADALPGTLDVIAVEVGLG
ncbi:hypothetical protein PPH41_05225 [Burkholderia gladioli]|nr:hypothetical protein [Burkholderia gladioli]